MILLDWKNSWGMNQERGNFGGLRQKLIKRKCDKKMREKTNLTNEKSK